MKPAAIGWLVFGAVCPVIGAFLGAQSEVLGPLAGGIAGATAGIAVGAGIGIFHEACIAPWNGSGTAAIPGAVAMGAAAIIAAAAPGGLGIEIPRFG